MFGSDACDWDADAFVDWEAALVVDWDADSCANIKGLDFDSCVERIGLFFDSIAEEKVWAESWMRFITV